jgi:DNA-binding transcriptional MerR regulator
MNQYIVIGDTARRLMCNPATVKNLERRGLLTAYRDHRGWRFYDVDEVDRLRIDRQSQPRRVESSGRTLDGVLSASMRDLP